MNAQPTVPVGNTPFFFGGNTMPQQYGNYLGPFVFDPFALDLASRAAIADGSRVLELACGTGLVTRHLAAWLLQSAQLPTTDINPRILKPLRGSILITHPTENAVSGTGCRP